jgi:hypothetical protein
MANPSATTLKHSSGSSSADPSIESEIDPSSIDRDVNETNRWATR